MSLHTFRIAPFDIELRRTDNGFSTLQSQFTGWARSLGDPARFVCWQMPADLEARVEHLRQLEQVTGGQRHELLEEYRRHTEFLNDAAVYQRTVCGLALWSDQNPQALAISAQAAFATSVTSAPWPALFVGEYELRESPLWHLAPAGNAAGRPYWAILNSYEFQPARWDFYQPLKQVLDHPWPLAIAVDIPKTYDRIAGVEALEAIIQAYDVHLASVRGEDSRSVQRIQDCRRTLQEMHAGDQLHLVQISIAVAADDLDELKQRAASLVHELRPWVNLRPEVGELLARSVGFFRPKSTPQIGLPDTSWPVVSHELAIMFAPLGVRKLATLDGVLRGDDYIGHYPLYHNSWRDKRATHEVWVGSSGSGKTFACNCYLTREYAENGIPFDLLEPMGHGQHIASAFGLPWYVLSANATCLNPQDVMFETLIEQISHTTRIYETVLGRPLSGGQRQNLERGLLGEALEIIYRGYPDFAAVTPELSPTTDLVCDVLSGLGDKAATQAIAKDLADEIAALCTGNGPWASFLNGVTNIDLTRTGNRRGVAPRVFSFHELESDPILQALAYTQVLSAIRRDALYDEQPRIIAVDEVYRLMRHPSLLAFLIEAAKTFRTRRKKLISIDQNMSVFLEPSARMIFENSPIRVIFSQRQGMNVFHEDAAFQHFNPAHRNAIAGLQRGEFLFDVQDEGIWRLMMTPTMGELARFGTT